MRATFAIALVAAVAAAGAAAAAPPLVPTAVQGEIAVRTPRLAYVPARGAIPYRYRSWSLQAGVLRLRFANRNEPGKVIVFEARVFHGTCRTGMQRSFQMAGVKTWYSVGAGRRQAWRCVHGTKLIAWTRLGPRTFADAGLARIAASGHRIHLS